MDLGNTLGVRFGFLRTRSLDHYLYHYSHLIVTFFDLAFLGLGMKISDISDIGDARHDIGDDRYIADISVLDRYIVEISGMWHTCALV